ncbi:MAG: Uma2 family endonuclease [Pseudomonadota bacterium]
MNIHVTQAAEGLKRRGFTIADVERMVEIGVLGEDERFELIGGEIVPMSPKGIRHERVKQWFTYELVRGLPERFITIPETTFRLSEDTFLEPDFVVYAAADGLENLSGKTCLLAIEVSNTSLAYDRGRKGEVYAEFGVPQLWVVDVKALETRVFSKPADGRCSSVQDFKTDALLTPLLVDDFSISLKTYA